jgi:predicted dehydrogenase
MIKKQSTIHQYCEYPAEVNVLVAKWIVQVPINDQYISYKTDWRLVSNYIKRIGFLAVLRKIRSRLGESVRNQKIAGIGYGFVVNNDPEIKKGQPILFFAPNHNPRLNVLVVRRELFIPVETQPISTEITISGLPDEIVQFSGWSPYSGVPIKNELVKASLVGLAKFVGKVDPPNTYPDLKDHINFPDANSCKPKVVLFGLGNYAKTVILPNIRQNLHLARVHEIDPDQILGFKGLGSVSIDTSPKPREDLKFDAWFIAGFHHTHADIAIKAIESGSAAVIEKPLATNMDQYNKFLRTVQVAGARPFFSCFQKRYSKMNEFLFEDLGFAAGDRVNMHAIVFEIPLPKNHWYNWPNSGSRLISNGCHWIDYFMFLNQYCEVAEFDVWRPCGTDVTVSVKLKNGAYLSLSLTDVGSPRLGVRDYIQLRVADLTVTMVDGHSYVAENRNRIIRQTQIDPMSSYRRMYQDISKRIALGMPGDEIESLRSTELTLWLEYAAGLGSRLKPKI